MAQITHGEVTVLVPDSIQIPAEAGKLSPDQVSEIAKAPRGIGIATANAAAAARNAGAKFVMPADVTADALEKAGDDAEEIDDVIASLEVVLTTLKQANLLLDAHAWSLLRKLNDQINAQGKTNAEVLTMFAPVTAYMRRSSRPRKPTKPT